MLSKNLLLAAAVLFVWPLVGQDMAKVAPKNCRVLVDNERVRVIQVIMKPGDKVPMHSHPANITYDLTGGKIKYTYADGKTEEQEGKAGEALWSDATSHSSENVGAKEMRSIMVELKK